MEGGKKRKTNSSLSSWIQFVKKIEKDEGITYKEAMVRASARKSEWKRGGSDSTDSTSNFLPEMTKMDSDGNPSVLKMGEESRIAGGDGDTSSSPSNSDYETADEDSSSSSTDYLSSSTSTTSTLSGGKRTKKRRSSKKSKKSKKSRKSKKSKKSRKSRRR